MSKRTIVFCTGIFVALLPFLGFPQSWDTTLFVIAGLVLAVVVWIPMRRGKGQVARNDGPSVVTDRGAAFVENRPSEAVSDHRLPLEIDTPPRTARIRVSRPRSAQKPKPRTRAVSRTTNLSPDQANTGS